MQFFSIPCFVIKVHGLSSSRILPGELIRTVLWGIHDVHVNQGSQSQNFLNNGRDDHSDHNDMWQDGAVLVDLGQTLWAAYFTAFTQQLVPTDRLGNPVSESHEIVDSDDGTLAIAGH